MDRESLLSKPLFCLFAFLLLGGLIGTIVTHRLNSSEEAQNWVMHTYRVLQHVEELNTALHEAESGARGHVATGDEAFLVAYKRRMEGHESIDAELVALRRLVQDNRVQEERLAEIDRMIVKKRNFMAHTIEVVQREKGQRLTEAQQLLHQGTGIQLMADIQAGLREFRDYEQGLLEEREARARNYNQMNAAMLVVLSIVLVCIMVAGFLATRKEFERRRITESKLRDSGAFQKALIDGASYAIIACDLEGTVRLFNHAAETLTGYAAEEIVGIATPALWHLPQEVVQRAEQLTEQLGIPVEAGFEAFVKRAQLYGADEREWTFVRKDGSQLTVLLGVTALQDGTGHLSGYLGIGRDITERKQVEQMKNEFISTVSHELRTPLTSIRGALGLIAGNMSEALPDQAKHLVGIAHKNSERLVRLINNILDIEKIESGNLHFENRVLDVDRVMELALAEMKGLAGKSNVLLVIEMRTDGAQVVGDEDRLLQVMGNLISNAVKFSPEGGTVFLSTVRAGQGIMLSVRDAGPGVPDAFRQRIFGKFAQADGSDTRQKSGSGLGLSISKAIIDSIGGTLEFESQPGRTQFFVTLPEWQGGRAVEPEAQAERKLLIVEDDEDIAMLLKLSLEREGYVCDVAGTARRARALLAGNTYFAMTLDLNLPDQDGLALIRELRQQESTLDLPIIVVSANAEDGRKKLNGEAIGVLGWLPKPIDLVHLKRLLGSVVGGKVPDILYIEDEADIITVMTSALEGVAVIDPAGSLREARAKLKRRHYDLAILDIMLPDGNGLDLLHELAQREKPIPVIILSVAETSQEVQRQVMASMVKSVVTEDKVIATIKSLILRRAA